MIRKTVGVAPGSYTLQLNQLGAPQYAPNSWQLMQPQVQCPPDENGTGAWGTPTWDWYGYSLPPLPPPMVVTQGPPSTQTEAPLLDPYGTQSMLKGPSYGARYHDMMRRKQVLARMGFKGLAGLGTIPAWQQGVANNLNQKTSGITVAQQAIQAAVPAYTGVPANAGLPPSALATLVDTTPWWQQWYVLGPALLVVAYFGWKKLGQQHAAAVAASPPAPATP